MKKLIPVLLVVLLLAGLMSVSAVAATYTYHVTASSYNTAEINFTPTQDGGYTFGSSSSIYVAPKAELYDASGSCIGKGDSIDSGEFCFYIELKASKNYVLKVNTHNIEDQSFDVNITQGRYDGGPASFEEATQPGTYHVKAGYETAFISFTPQKTGQYTFESAVDNFDIFSGGCIPRAALYDGNTQILGYVYGDNNSNFNFSAQLEANKTYRIEFGSSTMSFRTYDVIIGYEGEETDPTGFTLSGGNLWIVIAGGVVILGGIAAIIIVSKKKKKETIA